MAFPLQAVLGLGDAESTKLEKASGIIREVELKRRAASVGVKAAPPLSDRFGTVVQNR